MKTNKMMRIASVLLVAVLLTTCVISGTFAKYVTSDSASDTARVAKFGVTIEADGTLFNDAYAAADAFGEWAKPESDNALTVCASTENTNVVAPGTKGTLTNLAVTGTPEVDVEVTYVATLTLENWTAGGAEYCPIEITVGSDTFKVGEGEVTDIATLISKVEAAIEGKTAVYHTNTDLSAVNDDVQVSWAWDYEGNDDVKDTALGDAATAATITLEITTTITQVD